MVDALFTVPGLLTVFAAGMCSGLLVRLIRTREGGEF